MSDKIAEVKKDIAELESLVAQATRPRVKDILSIEIRRQASELIKLEEQQNEAGACSLEAQRAVAGGNKSYQVKLNNYAWDQTSKFVKLYVTVNNVLSAPPENVFCTFTNKSIELNVKNLDNKDYVLVIKNLLEPVDPAASSWKVKKDMVVVSLAKVKQINWSHVTELEKRASDAKKIVPDKMDEDGDPTAGLMNIMKKMYESGDDEMKRTIAKAWTEGQEKNRSMNL